MNTVNVELFRLVLKSSSWLFSLTTESTTRVAANLLAEAKYLLDWDEGGIDFLISLWFNGDIFVVWFSVFCTPPSPFCFLSGRECVQQWVWLAELLANEAHLSFNPPSLLPLNRVKTSFLCRITLLRLLTCVPQCPLVLCLHVSASTPSAATTCPFLFPFGGQ